MAGSCPSPACRTGRTGADDGPRQDGTMGLPYRICDTDPYERACASFQPGHRRPAPMTEMPFTGRPILRPTRRDVLGGLAAGAAAFALQPV
ncbi:twin-arginine translocation signal domain-containing protein, partial [Tistrella mobilis]|uniref:twin-arginine translocation signal domain-containing protein n=1 Tax=Tistrella mobilis TaxID=171437 RepID=UPI003626D796